MDAVSVAQLIIVVTLKVGRKMASDAQKGIFYLEESNENLKILLTFNVPQRHSSGSERTILMS